MSERSMQRWYSLVLPGDTTSRRNREYHAERIVSDVTSEICLRGKYGSADLARPTDPASLIEFHRENVRADLVWLLRNRQHFPYAEAVYVGAVHGAAPTLDVRATETDFSKRYAWRWWPHHVIRQFGHKRADWLKWAGLTCDRLHANPTDAWIALQNALDRLPCEQRTQMTRGPIE